MRDPHRHPSRSRIPSAALGLSLLAGFAVLGVTLVLRHEPWRDEADPWLMARDAGPLELIRLAGYAGTPALWFFLLVPLAKLGLPYLSMGLLNFAFALAAVAIFLRYAPFGWATKALFTFSYFASYEYAVPARSYALAMALIFALAALDRRRMERPIAYGVMLFLLFNANVHGALVAAAIALAFAAEALAGPKQWMAAGAAPAPRSDASARRTTSGPRAGPITAGVAIAALGALLAVTQLLPPADGQLAGAIVPDWRWIGISLGGAIFPTAEGAWWALLGGAIVYLGATLSLGRDRRALFVLLAASLGLWAVFALKYSGSSRHWGFLLLVLLHALWIARAEDREPSAIESATSEPAPRRSRSSEAGAEPERPGRAIVTAARAMTAVALPLTLAWSVFVATQFWIRDYRDRFSTAQAMAAYLMSENLTGLPIAAWPAPYAEALLPYLPSTRFFYPGIRDYGTYMKWDRACVAGWSIPEAEVLARVAQEFPAGRDVLLLTNQPMFGAASAGFRLLHTEIGRAMIGDEQYFLYRRGGAR